MKHDDSYILTVDGSSSNIKFALNEIGERLNKRNDVSGHEVTKLTGGKSKKSPTPEIPVVDVGCPSVVESESCSWRRQKYVCQ